MTVDAVIAGLADRCDRIRAGMDELGPFLAPVLPVRGDDVDQLPVVERIASIALLKRYEQLQDMLGRLMRACLSYEGYDVRDVTRRDQANAFEKMRFVADADDWMDDANLRNRLTHECPIAVAEQVDRVNAVWARRPHLYTVHDAVRAYLAYRGKTR